METSMEDEDEALRVWLYDERRTITHRYLAFHLRIHANVAKQKLYEIATKNPKDLEVRYFLSGEDSKGNVLAGVFPQEDLDSAKEKCGKISSIHVYSLALKGAYSRNQDKESLLGDVYASGSAIRNKSVIYRSKEVPQTSASEEKKESSEKVPPVEHKNSKENSAKGNFNKPALLSSKTKEFSEPSEQKPANKFSNDAKEKPKPKEVPRKGGLAKMWAKAAEKKAAEKENRINEKKEEEVERASRQKSAKLPKPSSSGSSSKKRKRVRVLSDSESSPEEDNEEEADARQTENNFSAKSQTTDSDDEIIPATPVERAPSIKRRKVKTAVTKRYLAGEYMHTKTEYEYKSEEEEEIAKPVVESPSKKIQPKEEISSKNKQASIMNFFKKK